MRVVSLLPSATEIVYALGLGDELVGVTFECDEPPEARRDKAIVVGGRDTSAMTPAAIDAYVRAQLAAGGDLYTLHADALAGLAPELILTQDLCRVCALPTDHVQDALGYLGCNAEVISLDPHSLDDVLATILTVGRRAGVAARVELLVTELRQRLADIAAHVARAGNRVPDRIGDGTGARVADRVGDGTGARVAEVADRPRPAVAVIEWVDPPFTAGHWVPDLVSAAGGRPVAAHPGEKSQATTWEAIAAAEPDVVVVAPCGFHLDGAAAQAEVVARHLPGIPLWAIDADGLVVRPGPRLVDGVAALASILHPDAGLTAPEGSVRRIA